MKTRIFLATALSVIGLALGSGSPALAGEATEPRTEFSGSGFGPTADAAVDAAVADAKADAAANGFTDCTVVGDPIVTASANPGERTIFNALVVVGCLP
jgi:hypothetical protein